MKLGALLVSAPLLLASLGCASLPSLSERPEEYALYRATRVAPTLEERLRAADRYLREVPRGRRHQQLKAWFEREEELYYLAAFDRIGALYAYEAALPSGPHINEVKSRIAALEARRARRKQRVSDDDAAIAAGQARLIEAAAQRRAFVRTLKDWAVRVTSIDSFGEPTSELADETIFAFRLSAPRGSCRGDSCKKLLQLSYLVPGEGKLLERVSLLEVQLELERGLLTRARLAGPELWTRLGEALSLEPVDSPTPEQRAAGIERAKLLIQGVLEARFPSASCQVEPSPGAILERACGGLRARMAAGSGADDDFFEVFPEAPPAP